MWGVIGQHRQSAPGEAGNLTASLSKSAAQRYWQARIAPLSFIFSLMVLNTAEHLFSGRCSQKSLVFAADQRVRWENKGRKGCFEECFFYAQRLYIWSSRTTCKIKMTTSHTNVNNAFLTASWDYPVFYGGLTHFGVMHQVCITDVIFFFCSPLIFLSLNFFFLSPTMLKSVSKSKKQ